MIIGYPVSANFIKDWDFNQIIIIDHSKHYANVDDVVFEVVNIDWYMWKNTGNIIASVFQHDTTINPYKHIE